MSQKLAVNGFEWVEEINLSKFNKRFIKNYNENSDKGYILEVDVEYQKKLLNSHRDLPFLPEKKKVCALNAKAWSYLRDDSSEIRKAKGTKKM